MLQFYYIRFEEVTCWERDCSGLLLQAISNKEQVVCDVYLWS